MEVSWREKSPAQKFELYTRVSLYLLVVGLGLLAVVQINGAARFANPPATSGLVAYGVGYAVWIALTLAALRYGISHMLQGEQIRRRLLIFWVSWGAGLAVLSHLVFSSGPWILPDFQGSHLWVIFLLFTCGSSPYLASRQAVLAFAVISVAAAVTYVPHYDGLSGVINRMSLEFFSYVALWASFRVSLVMLQLMWRQVQHEQTRAQLAVSEERLRFSRDLHDIFGRTLSAVSLKTDLARQLIERCPADASIQLSQVQDIVQETQAQMREVVSGYRRIDLQQELAGAQDLLQAAHIVTEMQVSVDVGRLPARVQESLAWAVREAVTNILKHSAADQVHIELTYSRAEVLLRLRNNGLRPEGADSQVDGAEASGLRGMRERLSAVDGSLEVERQGSVFELLVRVPYRGVAAANIEQSGESA